MLLRGQGKAEIVTLLSADKGLRDERRHAYEDIARWHVSRAAASSRKPRVRRSPASLGGRSWALRGSAVLSNAPATASDRRLGATAECIDGSAASQTPVKYMYRVEPYEPQQAIEANTGKQISDLCWLIGTR